MLEKLKEFNRTRLILGVIILAAIPCYCLGLVILWNNNLQRTEQTPSPTTILETLDGSITPTFTLQVVTQTATLTPTMTQTFTPTITYVIPPTSTLSPSPTPTNTQIPTVADTLEPTFTFTPTYTSTFTLTPSDTPPDFIV